MTTKYAVLKSNIPAFKKALDKYHLTGKEIEEFSDDYIQNFEITFEYSGELINLGMFYGSEVAKEILTPSQP